LIDMGRFSDVVPAEDGSNVTIGVGAKWGKVYQILDAKQLAVAGGRNSAVGVGGLILGGLSQFQTSVSRHELTHDLQAVYRFFLRDLALSAPILSATRSSWPQALLRQHPPLSTRICGGHSREEEITTALSPVSLLVPFHPPTFGAVFSTCLLCKPPRFYQHSMILSIERIRMIPLPGMTTTLQVQLRASPICRSLAFRP
jgi:hypothetical protein